MSNASSGSSKKRKAAARATAATRPADTSPDRPFDPKVFERARELAGRYSIRLENDGGGYLARAVEFPTVFVRGRSPNDCERKIREALTVAAATMLEMNEAPPLPATERRSQVNFRLSAEEKEFLEECARRAGFRGLSEFVRFAALAMARDTLGGGRRAG